MSPPILTPSAEEDTRGVGFNFTKNVAELWHVLKALVRVPPAITIAPLQRPAANGGTVHELRKQMLGVALPILKVRSALKQNDSVAQEFVLVRQFGPNRWRYPVAKLVEGSLNSTAFEFRYWHRSSLFAGAV
jgi:hypothetical protein